MFRQIAPTLFPLLTKHLTSLSDDDRFLRFHGTYNDIDVASWVERIVPARDVVLAHVTQTGRGLQINAAAVLQPFVDNRDGSRAAEMSLSVSAPSRRTGIGTALIQEAKKVAAASGIGRICFEVHERNHAARRLICRAGAKHSDGCLDLKLPCAQLEPIKMLPDRSLVSGPVAARLALCIHGAGGDAWQFQREAFDLLLRAGYRCLAVSIPEFSVHRAYSACAGNDALAAISERITAICLDTPGIVLGHSLGARIAIEVSDRLDVPRLALLNPMPLDGLSQSELRVSSLALACPRASERLSSFANYQASPHRSRHAVVVHGCKDQVSSLDYAARSLRRCIKASDGRLFISGFGHLGMRDVKTLSRAVTALN